MEGKIAQSLASKVEKQFGKAERKEALMQSLGEHFVEKYLPNATWNPQILVSMFSGLTVCVGVGGATSQWLSGTCRHPGQKPQCWQCVCGGGGSTYLPRWLGTPRFCWLEHSMYREFDVCVINGCVWWGPQTTCSNLGPSVSGQMTWCLESWQDYLSVRVCGWVWLGWVDNKAILTPSLHNQISSFIYFIFSDDIWWRLINEP